MAKSPGKSAGKSATRHTEVVRLDLGSLVENVGYRARRAQIAIFGNFIAHLKGVDLRPAQYAVLVIIDRNPGCKQSDIANALGIQKPNFGAMMDELIKRGLVLRVQSAQDKRSYAISLTPQGVALLREAERLVAEHEAGIEACIGKAQREDLLASLALIEAAL